MWKMDLKGAYTLLSFRPEDVGLFGMLLTDNMVYFQIAEIFGWAGTPAAFQVVTRAIQWELQHCLRSSTIMYVDDIIGVCLDTDITSDLNLTRKVCTSLLSPTAVADDETEIGRHIDVINYVIDLDSQRVSIARKNFLNALHGFASVDLTKNMTLRMAQRLASWSSRYGKICRVMRPFCGALNRLIAGRTEVHASFSLSSEAKITIKTWQAMLCLVHYQESRFTRTLESFYTVTPITVAEFDASLIGAGVIWYKRDNNAEEVVGVCAVEFSFLKFGVDSSFQNLSEFIGAIVSVIGHVAMGNRGRTQALRGDSITALTWAITERPRGSIVTKAAMIWILLCVAADIDIREVTHIPGKDNDKCDQLSRRGLSPHNSVHEHAEALGIGGARVLQMQDNLHVMTLLRLCDPATGIDTDEEFTTLWTTAPSNIDALLDGHPLRFSALPNRFIPTPH